MTEIINAGDVLHEAANLVTCERHADHGEMSECFDKIASVWNGILLAAGKSPRVALDAHDVATLMEGMKIARRYSGRFHPDDYIDSAGYAGCAYEVRRAGNGR